MKQDKPPLETEEKKREEIAEEVVQSDQLVFNKVETNTEKIIFFLFTIFFLFIIFTQLSISKSFMVNSSVKSAINNLQNTTAFEDVQTLEEFRDSYQTLVKMLYGDMHYSNYQKTLAEKYAFNNFNYVVSSVRLTQRRMNLKDNESEISKRYIKKMWAGSEIEYDDGKSDHEFTGTFGPGKQVSDAFEYQKDLSYENKGGYVINLDIYNNTLEQSNVKINAAMDNKWLDDQTASLVTDFVVYNPYLEILMYTRLIVKVEPSGRLKTKISTEALRRSYYSDGLSIFRAICECLFLIICLFYISRKGYEIYQECLEIKTQFHKAEKKKKIQNEEEEKLKLEQIAMK
jgi:hypothetical protein